MGSVETYVRCPDCGMNAEETFYYHNGSFDVRCPVCGFYCHRIRRGAFAYEDSDLDGNVYINDPAADCDIDGYARVIRHTDKDVDNLVAHVREDQSTYNGVEITQDENGEYWAINKFEEHEWRITNMQIPKEYYDVFDTTVKEYYKYEEYMGPLENPEEIFLGLLSENVRSKCTEEANKLGIDWHDYKDKLYGSIDTTFAYREGKVKIIFDKVDKFAELSKYCISNCDDIKSYCHSIRDKIDDRNLKMFLDIIVSRAIDITDAIEKLNKYR